MTGTWKNSQAGGRTSARSDAADRLRNVMLSDASVQFPHSNLDTLCTEGGSSAYIYHPVEVFVSFLFGLRVDCDICEL